MLPLRYPWLWLGAGIGALVVILILALIPLTAPIPIRGFDKFLHVVAFVFLTVWFLGVFEQHLSWRVAIALAAYGGLIELVQGLMPYRIADPFDVLSDLAGILVGWLLAAAGMGRWCQRVEAFLGVVPP